MKYVRLVVLLVCLFTLGLTATWLLTTSANTSLFDMLKVQGDTLSPRTNKILELHGKRMKEIEALWMKEHKDGIDRRAERDAVEEKYRALIKAVEDGTTPSR